MSIRRVVLSSFVLLALARTACVVADDLPTKPVLGPAVPIGELLILKASLEFDGEPQPLPSEPTPLLPTQRIPPQTEGLPAPPLGPADDGDLLRTAAPIRVCEEIPFHLTQAILGMRLAGLNEQADRAASLLKEFQTKHQSRLLLAAKQAQLSELQAEVHRLKLRVEKGITAEQVQLSVKIIEVERPVGKDLLKAAGGDPVAITRLTPTKLDGNEFLRQVEAKRKVGAAKFLAEPILVSRSGLPARLQNGGSFPTGRITQTGGPESLEFGTTVLATATIMDKDLIDLVFTGEMAELDWANATVLDGKSIPGLTRRRVRTHVELKSDQTLVVGGMVTTREEKEIETFITVTAEIIEPTNEPAVPLAPPAEVPQPTSTLPRPVK